MVSISSNLSRLEEDNPVKLWQPLHLMRNRQDDAVTCIPVECASHCIGRYPIEARERLIQNEDGRVP